MWRALIGLLLLGCAARPEVREEALRDATWLEVKAASTTVRTNLPPAAAEKVTRALECDRQALSLWTGVEGARPAFEVEAIVLERRSQLAQFADGYIGGLHAHQMGSSLLVLAAEGDQLFGRDRLPATVRRHEVAHALLYAAMPRQPRWLAEGLAAYLETATRDGRGTITFGRPHGSALGLLERRSNRVALDALRAWQGFALPAHEVGPYYATAWAWVHFLLNERRTEFTRYLQHLADGMNDDAAWRDAFPEPIAILERVLTGYLQTGYFQEQRVKVPACETYLTHAPLSPAGIHTTLAQLWLSSPRRSEERARRARDELNLALALEPEAPAPQRLLLYLDRGSPGAR